MLSSLIRPVTPFLFFVLLFSSCIDVKKAIYFNETYNKELESGTANLEPIIQKNDLLSITVSSLLPAATEIFNAPNDSKVSSNTTSGSESKVSGYLVNQQGFIQFPLLGEVRAAGIPKNELGDNIAKSLVEKKLLLEPIVTVRYLNFKITVLGEVGHPAVVNVQNEKITLLEALGLAGDVTIYGNRSDIRVIRDVGDKKIVKSINLNTSEIFDSPYYYLKSNDIVYVEPNKSKIASTSRATLWVPVVLSAFTAAIIVFDRLSR